MLRGFYSNVRHLVQMRHVVLLALAMCCASVIVTTLPSHAGASSLPGNQTVATPITPLIQFAAPGENTTTTQDGQEITCVGGPLGYITCPLIDITSGTIKFIAAFLDVIFNFQALSNDAMRSAWGVFVNLANIMIGIAFLIIIMSQATSMGISSYGIKRTLPRIVAAVILINMSFYVCAFAIDVSNVLGHNMMSFVSSLSEGIESPPTSSSESSEEQSSCSKVGGVVGGATGGIIGAAGGPVGIIAGTAAGAFFGSKVGCTISLIAGGLTGGITIITVIIAVGLVAIFIAFITTLALAIIRYVLLIFLVVLAPLAFAAWVLPNTEKYFQKWWGMFSKLLMIYPAVMFMFGASMFAADIVGSVLGNGEFIKDLFPESGAITVEAVKAVWAVVQLFIIAMPLFFIPAMFKGMEGIAGKMKAGLSTVAKGASNKYKGTTFGKYRQMQKAERKALIAGGQYEGRAPHRKVRSKLNRRLNASSRFNSLSGGYGSHRQTIGENLRDERISKEAASFSRRFSENQNVKGVGDSATLSAIARDDKKPEAMRRAALDQLSDRREVEELRQIKQSIKGNDQLQKSFNANFARNASKLDGAPDLNPSHSPDTGGWDAFGKVSAQSVAGMHDTTILQANREAVSKGSAHQINLANSYYTALSDPMINTKLNNKQQAAMQSYLGSLPKSVWQPPVQQQQQAQPQQSSQPQQQPTQHQGKNFNPPSGGSGLWTPSDYRLKHSIRATGRMAIQPMSIPEYEFCYSGDDTVYIGVMAQDVIAKAPEAVKEIGGYLHVNYDKLGIRMYRK